MSLHLYEGMVAVRVRAIGLGSGLGARVRARVKAGVRARVST